MTSLLHRLSPLRPVSPLTTLTPLRRLQRLPLALALMGFAYAAQAQSLVDLYTMAKDYDATYQSARSQYDATLARGEQARAGVLPTVALTASASRSEYETSPSYNASYGTQSATISASQPLYRPANWASYEQGKRQVDLAQAQLMAADQDLIVRVSQAYFDVLAASDSLEFVKSQKVAVAEQLASAKRNFEVGTATITDTRDAQARYDLVIAQELAADNDLHVKSLALDQLVGRQGTKPKRVVAINNLLKVEPPSVEQWVQQAEENNTSVKQLQVALDVAKLETEKAQASHKPTLDLTGSYTTTNNNGTYASTGDTRANNASIGLSLNLPLFAGYSIQNRVRETLALEDKARTDLEATKRAVTQGTRSAFYGVQTGLSQVKAYEAAEASSQSALDANKLGYQVGVKINIDVLNAQSQLYDTKAKLAKARYDVLVGALKLRQAAGTLVADDLQPINQLLEK